MLRADPLVAGRELAIEHDLVDRLTIDREIERLPHLGGLAERALGLVVVDIDGEAQIAELGRGRELELGIGAHVLDIGREHALDQVEPARFQIGEPHRGIDDRQIHDAVDMDVVLVPVVGELLEHDAVLLHALDEIVGPAQTGCSPNLSPASFAAFGETIMPARSVSCAISGENGVFNTSLMVRGSTTSTWSSSRVPACETSACIVEVALERKFRGLGIERLAVVEFDARPQLDRDLLAVGGCLVGQRELRHDVELFVDVEQLVAERCEHDAAHIGARHGRVENVRDPRRARCAAWSGPERSPRTTGKGLR